MWSTKMSRYVSSRWVMLMSVVGTGVGGLVYLKDYVGGRKHGCPEQLAGKTVVITGANSGIGLETARELARKGARVIMACRSSAACEKERESIISETRNSEVVCGLCDLASMDSIRQFADRVLRDEPHVDVLINNAGVMRCPRTLTQDGFEMQFGVNHLGHFLLTSLLLDRLKTSAPSRVINVSSVAHVRGQIRFDDLNGDRAYDPGAAYNQSKLANVLFTKELAKRLQGTGVTTYAVHPGIVNTNIARHMGIAKSDVASLLARPLLWCFTKSPYQGMQTVAYCALSDDVKAQSGLYYSNCEVKEPSSAACDEAAAARLWAISERWTRIK